MKLTICPLLAMLVLTPLLSVGVVMAGNDDGNNVEIGIDYVMNYAPLGLWWIGNLDNVGTDAQGWYNVLGNQGFTQVFNNGNQSADESHFERSDDTDWADNIDFAYFAGHGNSTGILFATNNPNHIASYDQMTLGDQDLEWLFLKSCEVLAYSTRWQWCNIFASYGLHGMTGFETIAIDTTGLGSMFACCLTGTGGYSLMSIGEAWAYATEQDQPSTYEQETYPFETIYLRAAILCRAQYDPVMGILTLNYADEYLPGYSGGMYPDPDPMFIGNYFYDSWYL